MEPKRVQLSRKRGWRMPENTVKVTRPGMWGNPFIVNPHVTPGSKSGSSYICVPTLADAVECFRELMASDGEGAKARRDRLHELRGKNLACWCPLSNADGSPVHCHADVLLELANAPAASGGKR